MHRDWRNNWRVGACAIFIALLLILIDHAAHAQAETLADACDLDSATSLIVYDWTTGVETTLTGDVTLRALGAWTGEPTWVDTAEYGYFDEPPDLAWYLSITAELNNGETRYLYLMSSASQPDSLWLYAFDDLEVTTDANGEHYGAHDLCAYWKLSADLVNAWAT